MPAQIETSIWLALKERLATLTLPASVTLVMPKDDAPRKGKYVQVDWLPNTLTRFSLSPTGASRRPGILQLSIMSPLSTKEAPEVDFNLGGEIAAHFPQDLALYYGNVRVKITSPGDVAPSYRESGYWRTPISVYYSVDQ